MYTFDKKKKVCIKKVWSMVYYTKFDNNQYAGIVYPAEKYSKS